MSPFFCRLEKLRSQPAERPQRRVCGFSGTIWQSSQTMRARLVLGRFSEVFGRITAISDDINPGFRGAQKQRLFSYSGEKRDRYFFVFLKKRARSAPQIETVKIRFSSSHKKIYLRCF